MSRAEAVKALEAGIALAIEAKAEGVTLLGTGDMGIANTTPSSAIIAAISGSKRPGTDSPGNRHKR